LTEKIINIVATINANRIDKFLYGEELDLSRENIKKLSNQGYVLLNGVRPKVSNKVRIGDHISITIPPPKPLDVVPEPIPLEVVYEDHCLVVVDKPAGISVHPGPGHESGTLVNALLYRYPNLPGIGGIQRPGIVHRLDRDTSGLMVVAKTGKAHANISQQFKERVVVKRYIALVTGTLKPPKGLINGSIGRDRANRKRMAIVIDGKDARTFFWIQRVLDNHTVVVVKPETGRTHQIRVHLASIGHPLFGDHLYGRRNSLLPHHFLHAHSLTFRHPDDGKVIEAKSSLPNKLELVLNELVKISAIDEINKDHKFYD
jgi:23S rRNA pseudouridine1911/1915/1917 synthase